MFGNCCSKINEYYMHDSVIWTTHAAHNGLNFWKRFLMLVLGQFLAWFCVIWGEFLGLICEIFFYEFPNGIFDFGSLCVVQSLLYWHPLPRDFLGHFLGCFLGSFFGIFFGNSRNDFLDDFLDDIFGYGSLCIVQILLYWHPLPQDFGWNMTAGSRVRGRVVVKSLT